MIPFKSSGNNNPEGNGNRRNADRRDPDFYGNKGNQSCYGGHPNGQDPDDNDEGENIDDEESDIPNVDGHPLSVGGTPLWTHAESSTHKPGAKLPSLHQTQFAWNSERAKLKHYIQRWYDHLQGF